MFDVFSKSLSQFGPPCVRLHIAGVIYAISSMARSGASVPIRMSPPCTSAGHILITGKSNDEVLASSILN